MCLCNKQQHQHVPQVKYHQEQRDQQRTLCYRLYWWIYQNVPICNLNCLCLSSIVIQTSTCVTGAIKMFRDTRHFCIISIVRKVSYFPDISPNMGFQFSIYGRCCVGGVGIVVSTLLCHNIDGKKAGTPCPLARGCHAAVWCVTACHVSRVTAEQFLAAVQVSNVASNSSGRDCALICHKPPPIFT